MHCSGSLARAAFVQSKAQNAAMGKNKKGKGKASSGADAAGTPPTAEEAVQQRAVELVREQSKLHLDEELQRQHRASMTREDALVATLRWAENVISSKGKGKASPARGKGAKTGGGAVSRAKKAAKQQVRVVPTSRQSSRRTLSETSSRAPSRAAPRGQTRASDRSRPSPSRLPSGVGRRAVSRRRRVEW